MNLPLFDFLKNVAKRLRSRTKPSHKFIPCQKKITGNCLFIVQLLWRVRWRRPTHDFTGSNNTQPTADCSGGYYCPGGDVSPQFVCSIGHKCPDGSSNETVCPTGEYQPSEGMSDCITCPEGYICDPTDGGRLLYDVSMRLQTVFFISS